MITRFKTLQHAIAVSALGGTIFGAGALSHGLAHGRQSTSSLVQLRSLAPSQAAALIRVIRVNSWQEPSASLAHGRQSTSSLDQPRCLAPIQAAALIRVIRVNSWQEPPAGGDRLTPDQAKELKSPVPFTKQSIARGRITFSRNCTACHGADGKAQLDLVGNATDLTDPKVWQNGTAEGQIYRSIRDGAGNGMPPFKTQLHDEKAIWDLVNFIRSLWPEAARPKLQEDATTEKK